MSYEVGQEYVISKPVDPRSGMDGYGPGYENGTPVTVVPRTRNRPPVIAQAALDKEGRPDPTLPATVHVWVQSEQGEGPIWVQPHHIVPATN